MNTAVDEFLKRLMLRGTCGRLCFFIVGISAFGIKYSIDRSLWQYVAKVEEPFLPWSYLDPKFQEYLWSNPALLYLFIGASLLFLWIGVSHTILRLKDSELSMSLIFFFFVPVVNLLLFVLLSLVPTAPTKDGSALDPFSRVLPSSNLGAAIVSVALTAGGVLLLAICSVDALRHYGGGLFLGTPVAAGFASVVFASQKRPVSFVRALILGNLTVCVVGVALLLFAFEGIICILMAAPIGIILSSIGACGAWLILRIVRVSSMSGFHALGIVSLVIIIEPRLDRKPPVFKTTTILEIAAPRETVWQNVLAFSEIMHPPSFLFRFGLAYPVRARIEGNGVGAIRHCEFSTGSFVEPITVWDEPRELRFTVTQTPPPMEEWSPWRGIRPAHIEGYFTSKGGQFILENLPNNRTLVYATTWHQHRIWPAHYWRWWADLLIHDIHRRVLQHIEKLSVS